MNLLRRVLGVGWVVAWALASGAALAGTETPASTRVPLAGYVLVFSETKQGVTYLTYRADLTNPLPRRLVSAGATLTGVPAGTTILDGKLSFGAADPGATITSQDTFIVRQHPGIPLDPGQLRWTITYAALNRAPTADAGPDQAAAVGTRVVLDGRASSDPDGDPLKFWWRFVSRPPGSQAKLFDATLARPSFLLDREGAYVLELVVSDGKLVSPPDRVEVSTGGVPNTPPVAHAGADQTVPVGTTVQLDASASTDQDGHLLTFRWRFASRPPGSAAVLSDPAALRPTFTVDRAGSFLAELVVNDGRTDSAPDLVQVSTVNSRPIASAGPDQTVPVGATVVLDGRASGDVDLDPLSFRWAFVLRPEGSAATLDDPSAVRPSFIADLAGRYVVRLIVDDGALDSVPDTVQIDTLNSAPVADAGPDLTGAIGTPVTLDGRSSADADGDPLTFRWSFTTRPETSAATLDDPTLAQPTFTPDRPGDYVAQLIVNDGTLDSAPDTAVITVPADNQSPVADAGPDQTVARGATVQLDGGGSSDPEGAPLTFAWTLLSRPNGSAATLVAATTAAPTFVADVRGVYLAQLVVRDGALEGAPDVVRIEARNTPPVADAGPDRGATVGTPVQLTGRASSDPDGDALTFRWALTGRPNGSAAAFVDPVVAEPTFVPDVAGTYVAELVVNDGSADGAPDTVVVTATTANQPPIANAGPDQTVARGVTVRLDGGGSSDPEAAPLTFAWTLLSRPPGSTATLVAATTATPTFVASLNGAYIAQLVVSDGIREGAPDTVTITVQDGADLRIFFEVPPAATPPVGGSISPTLRIDNLGPAATTGVTAHVPIPAGYTFVNSALSTYDSSTGIWTIGSLPSGSFERLALGLGVNAVGPHDLTATITGSSQPDPNPTNNTATATVTPNQNADLRVGFFNPPAGTFAYGAGATPHVEVENLGPARTTGVMVRFLLPAGYTRVGGIFVSPGSYDTTTGDWAIGTLASGQVARLILGATVNPTGSTALAAAITASDHPDPSLANNTATAPAINRPPVANAGPDQAAVTDAPVVLDGTQSSDPDGNPITFDWTLLLRPANSAVGLLGAGTARPSFVPDQVGPYVARLVVRDSLGVASAEDTVRIEAGQGNRPPVITSLPTTTGAEGQPYRYDVLASDPDASDTLTFSLDTAPAGMAIDALTGRIDWTPAAGQSGPQAVAVRVRDPGGLFAAQGFTIQVSTPGNPAPVAADDAYTVRVSESLSVPAPGILANDVNADGGPLSAVLRVAPTNGTVSLAADGSFVYTPHRLQPGDLVFAENVNLASAIPGVTVTASTSASTGAGTCLAADNRNGPQCAIDGSPGTSWLSSDQAAPRNLQIVFPHDVTVSALRLLGHRTSSLAPLQSAFFQLFDAAGTELFATGVVDLPLPARDATIAVPDVPGVRFVRVTDGMTDFARRGFAELAVIGSGLVRRERFVEPNLAHLLPASVRASSTAGFNAPVFAIDDTGANWYAASANAGEFVEISFPADVIVTQIVTHNPSARPDGFATSDSINCSGSFTLRAADDSVLFDSGVVNEPSGPIRFEDTFSLPVPSVGGVRRVRYTSAGCVAVGTPYPTGFAEIRVLGSAAVTTPALGLTRKFQALVGREAHSTPIVANLSDDNGDGVIDARDVPDIIVPVESLGNQITGEIKIVSGDDGRELFTAGGPNLVSPWAEVAAGDLDGDGIPEIVAVHADGNHLIAFDNTGGVRWLSDTNTMHRFVIGSATLITGAVAIANLDGGPRPHVIVGASVFDADGRLLGDGRTLGGTTGGTGKRSAISAVADIDLDGVPELVAGPTAYRLVGGALTRVWQRTDRPDGYVALGNFDDDPQAEIVIVANGVVYMLNHDGSDAEVWNPPTHAPIPIPGGGEGGAPVIADVDGDGIPEIGVAGFNQYVVFNRDGSVKWQATVRDASSNATGATVFDLDGDGQVEVIYRDEFFLRIYRGADGVLLAKIPLGSSTWSEQPVVADVDNDGHADLVVVSDPGPRSGLEHSGVHVFQDVANKWIRTRRIWNQHAYHVTNVNEDGSIPRVETPHWLVPGLNSFRLNSFVPGESPDAADSFTYVASDGVLESNVATVRIAVRTPNSPPRLTSSPVTTAATGVLYTYAAQAADPDAGDVLTFSLPAAPAGMTIDPASGLVQWTPTPAQLGRQDVVVRVQDARGAFALQGYAVQVAGPLTVPDVVGQPQETAASTISGTGLAVGSVTTRASATVAAGAVLGQSPVGGTLAAPGAPVSLVVSLGPPPQGIVPAVVGLLQPGAEADIAAAGFVLGTVASRHDASTPLGTVLDQAPAAGTMAPTGSAVGLIVSLGLPPGDRDLDGDGFTGNQGDCDDTNPAIRPGAVDIAGDGIDQNCNGRDSIAGDDTPPTAAIESPAEDAVITMLTDIVGTATDANFLRYTLELAGVDDTVFRVIGSGTAPVVGGVLGRLDPTLLENGMYRVRLTAEDVNGQRAVAERVYLVEGLAKIGAFRLSFTDLSVPVAGLPISIVRTYDSRIKTREDFGIGWTLDIKRGLYQHNRTPGEAWQILPAGFPSFPCRLASETAPHLTQVRLSDYESYTFSLALTDLRTLLGGCEATATFVFTDGRRPGATLEILDGTDVLYVNGSSQVVYPDTFLTFNPARVRLTTADGRIFDFERGVGITRVQEPNGHTLTIIPAGIIHSSGKSVAFTRDDQGRIIRITDPSGNALGYGYDGPGDLRTFVDQAGNRTTFAYDSVHNLVEITDPLGRRAVRTEYDAAGRVVAVIDAAGNRRAIDHDLDARLELITDRLGNLSVVEYDPRGNVVRQVDPLGNITQATYDPRDNVLSETDPLGNTRTFAYDTADNVVTQIDALGNRTTYTYNARNQELTRTDPRGAVTTLAYDPRGNLLAQTDPLGNVTRHTYDDRGLLQSTTDAAGGVRTYAYDQHGNETRVTDPLGNVLQRTYDANGNLLTSTATRLVNGALQPLTTTYGYDAQNRVTRTTDSEGGTTHRTYTHFGAPEMVTDALGRVTRRVYDDLGRLTRIVQADGTVTTNTYDAEGRRIRRADAAGRVTSYAFDAASRPVATTLTDGATRRVVYDAAGRATSVTDENGRTSTLTYDATGRLIGSTDPLGGTATITYDAAGNIVSQRDRNGNVSSLTHDLLGRVIQRTFADGTSVRNEYDAVGRLVARTDQEGRVTRYEHNERGDLVAAIDALGQRTTYGYDEAGKRVAQTDALGRTTRFAYDRVGRLVTRTLPLGQSRVSTYDAVGNVTTVVDAAGQSTGLDYDALNRLVRRALPDGEIQAFSYTATGQLASMTDSRGATIFEYDVRSRPSLIRHPDGTDVRYAYDARGNRVGLTTPAGTTTFTYDAANRLTTLEDPARRRTTFAYDPQGNATAVTYPNGVLATYGYDTLSRLIGAVYTQNGTTLRSYTYTLGPRGQRLRAEESTGRAVDYAYDALGRLIQERVAPGAAGPVETTAYGYDAVGNRLTTTDSRGTTSYTYDANHRLTAAGTVAFTYDANGNLASRTQGGAVTAYEYDTLGRLRRVTRPNGDVTRYTYDARNRRVQRLAPGGGTSFLVDPFDPSGLAQILRETDDATGVTDYVYAGATPLSQDRGGSVSFHVKDGQTSTRLLVDSGGRVTDGFDYDAFGNLIDRTGSTPTSHLFNGQQLDPDADLYFLRARDYDPAAGRFTAVDPAPGALRDPISLHPYLYARNDPVNFSDPTGETTIGEVFAVINIVGTLAGLATAAYDLSQGNYKAAAIEAGLSVIPYSKIFRWVGRGIKALGSASKAASLPANVATETDLVVAAADLAPEFATDAGQVLQFADEAAAVLPQVENAVGTRVVSVAAQAGFDQGAVHLVLSADTEIFALFNNLRRLIKAGTITSSYQVVRHLRHIVGTPGWQAKLCAIALAADAIIGLAGAPGVNTAASTIIGVAVNLMLQGSGFQCSKFASFDPGG